jgi:hypothetical protein
MMPRDLLDRAKEIARSKTGIAAERMLISATHTHSAPAAMGALGCAPDEAYVAFLPGKIAESIEAAVKNLRPVRVGWASVDDAENTHCRRWIRRLDKPVFDPFGQPSARANMHPGYQNPDAIGPSGPVDPELSVLAVQTPDGKPVALLANYSMHYFGTPPVSADYFGRFAAKVGELIGADGSFVGIMSQGTSGDQHWMDYSQPRKKITIDEYAASVAQSAVKAYRSIEYHGWVPLDMAETTLRLKRREPDAARLEWARKLVATMGDRAPKTLPEVYAKEAIFLHDDPERELKLQAVRIGDLGIAAIPDEVFALSGLKIKARSPLAKTFTIELANGSEGYIPPPEQHSLGGYTTWPARTAALEGLAEPKIVDTVVGLLEKVAGKPARKPEPVSTPYAKAVLAAKPWAYWRMEQMEGYQTEDASGAGHTAVLLPSYAWYLDGPPAAGDTPGRPVNHAVQLGGSVLEVDTRGLGDRTTVVLAFWNGLAADADVKDAGTLVKDRPDYVWLGRRDRGKSGLILGLISLPSPRPSSVRSLPGTTEILPKTWYHLAVVRGPETVAVYLDGRPEVSGPRGSKGRDVAPRLVLGDTFANETFQGKLDEVAVFDRALTAAEEAALY